MADSKWCTQCGAENDVMAAFCKSCGKSMNGATQGIGQSSAMSMGSQYGQVENQQGYRFQNQNASQSGYGFQNKDTQTPAHFQTKPKLKPENGAGLGFSAYISVVALIIGVILFFAGQQLLDSYAGLTWYYKEEAAMGNFLRGGGGLCCILGIVGLIRYFIVKK